MLCAFMFFPFFLCQNKFCSLWLIFYIMYYIISHFYFLSICIYELFFQFPYQKLIWANLYLTFTPDWVHIFSVSSRTKDNDCCDIRHQEIRKGQLHKGLRIWPRHATARQQSVSEPQAKVNLFHLPLGCGKFLGDIVWRIASSR